MEEDRREQDLLVKTLKQMVKNVQRIRARQDENWKHIQDALKDARAERLEDEDDPSSQGSQTQLWTYPEDSEDEDDPVQPLSDAEDSVLGGSTQPEIRQSSRPYQRRDIIRDTNAWTSRK
jgi:hypothetical protein